MEEYGMSKKNKYDELANFIVQLVGGKENIQYVTHCVTRLRINVNDTTKVDTKKIEEIEGCLGVQWSGNQLQIIIGQAVADAYKRVVEVNNLQDTGSSQKPSNNEKKNPVIAILDIVAGCITPVIPGLIAGGFF